MATGLSQAAPQVWGKLSLEDKIERLRSVIKSRQREATALAQKIQRISSFLEEHDHDKTGNPTTTLVAAMDAAETTSDMQPKEPMPPWGWADGPDDDEVYF